QKSRTTTPKEYHRKPGQTSNEKGSSREWIISRGSSTIPNLPFRAPRKKPQRRHHDLEGMMETKPKSPSSQPDIETLATGEYKYGFETAVRSVEHTSE